MALSKNSFVLNSAKLLAGSVVAQGLGVVVVPILSRLFAPEAFGVAALFMSIAGIISVVACLRYDLSIMSPSSDEEASNLLGLSLLFVILVSGITYVIMLFADEHIAVLLKAPKILSLLWLIPIAVFSNGAFLAFTYWNSRKQNFGRLSIVRLVSSAVTQVGSIAAGFGGFVGGGALVVARILGQFISMIMLGVQIWRSDHRLFIENINWDKMITGLKRYKLFPIFNTWSAFLNTASQILPNLFLGYFFSTKVVGFFSFAIFVLFLPTSLIGQAIGQVFFQKSSQAKHQGRLGFLVNGVYQRLVALSLFPLIIIMILGKDLFAFIFGPEWSEAGVYAQILSPWIFVAFIYSPLTYLFIVLEAQKEALITDTTLFILRCIALIIGGYLSDQRMAILLFSLVGTIVLCGMIVWFLVRSGASLGEGAVFLFHSMLISTPLIIIIAMSSYVMKHDFYITLILIVFCAVAYYALVLYRDTYLRAQLGDLMKKIV